MNRTSCPVCGSTDITLLSVAFGVSLYNGEQCYCMSCGHGWRVTLAECEYSTLNMCAVSVKTDRLEQAMHFFAPFVPADAAVLEIGCATGTLAQMVRSHLPVTRYDAIELSPDTGRQAAVHLNRLYTEPLRVLLDKGEIEGGYDLVVISHVLEHLTELQEEILAMKRVLKPGGALFIEVPQGSGHPDFPADDNPTHYHFFSPQSLTRALGTAGLHVRSLATDVYRDARYAASLQVVATAATAPVWRGRFLSEHPLLKDEKDIIVWGAPSLVEDVLANYFDISKIDFFIDRDPGKQGSTRLGKIVKAPADLGREPRTIFINSLYWEDNIIANIAEVSPGVAHRIVRMRDVLSSRQKG